MKTHLDEEFINMCCKDRFWKDGVVLFVIIGKIAGKKNRLRAW